MKQFVLAAGLVAVGVLSARPASAALAYPMNSMYLLDDTANFNSLENDPQCAASLCVRNRTISIDPAIANQYDRAVVFIQRFDMTGLDPSAIGGLQVAVLSPALIKSTGTVTYKIQTDLFDASGVNHPYNLDIRTAVILFKNADWKTTVKNMTADSNPGEGFLTQVDPSFPILGTFYHVFPYPNYAGFGATELTVHDINYNAVGDQLWNFSVRVSGAFNPTAGTLTPTLDCNINSPTTSQITCAASITALAGAATYQSWGYEHSGVAFNDWSYTPSVRVNNYFTLLQGFDYTNWSGSGYTGAFSGFHAGHYDTGRDIGYYPEWPLTGRYMGYLRDPGGYDFSVTSFVNTVGAQ